MKDGTGELVPRGDLNTWVWCGHCGAAAWGVPPHGEGNPCPLVIERLEWEKERARMNDEAYIAKLDAERGYYLRAGIASEEGMPSIAETLRRVLGKDDK